MNALVTIGTGIGVVVALIGYLEVRLAALERSFTAQLDLTNKRIDDLRKPRIDLPGDQR